ncbi:esterase-like activity of phytase family protein [Belnapia sp. T18]|uniref:Esterase-like activity of phytase family protein n=1 Tax=Belnapia arida TaxID=2804533 RepID=A0ABS1UC89_9PROT|nr:esterase-like activity of phytase family protein [Belnapia arida]MBL6082274.1 esterase-like activity of phytase family protein [Belnapia arida]
MSASIDPATPELRVATFNASLNRANAGELLANLATDTDRQAQTVAEIIQRTTPDLLLVNEFDYAPGNEAADLFRSNYLEKPQDTLGTGGAAGIDFPYAFTAPSNTGIASGFDLNSNGHVVTTPGEAGYGDDALGFGAFPGQYGMAVFSRYPILTDQVRTFQTFLWKDMPSARLPDDPNTPAPADWYSSAELDAIRLPSKSMWDVPVLVNGEVIHLIVLHPTPPTFDGPEDRNGLRNADEIRLTADCVTPGKGDYIYDDQGHQGGLGPGARFVVMGDINADSVDGDSVDQAATQLLEAPRVDASLVPTSPGGPEQAAQQGGANAAQQGNPLFDTADFADTAPGNLRVDYVLPSKDGLAPRDAGVFWPQTDDPLFPLVGTYNPTLLGGYPSSDHKLTYMDLAVTPSPEVTSVGRPEFLGSVSLPYGGSLDGLQIGGLSAITYDAARGQYYLLSDDRSEDARFFTATIDLGDGQLNPGDLSFTGAQTLSGESGAPFAANSLDPEGLTLTGDRLYLSSEGDASALISPFVDRFGLDGRLQAALPVDDKYLPTADGSSGIRNNLAFEALTATPSGRHLYVGTEDALYQDGPNADLTTGSPSRIIRYDLASGGADAEYVYKTDPIQDRPDPVDTFATNGLVELLALDNGGHLLALERSFSTGVAGNDIRLYYVDATQATDVSDRDALDCGYTPVRKSLVLDLDDLGIPLDNIEGMTFGSDLPDGRKTLLLVADDNFSATQMTQVIALALELNPATQTVDWNALAAQATANFEMTGHWFI